MSAVASVPEVRAHLIARQQDILARACAAGEGIVAEGRDIGTVVAPQAVVKVYLTASDDERARRRQIDEQASDRAVGVDEVRSDLHRRDTLDSSRATSPLRVADDAIAIDTTVRSVDDIVGELVRRAHEAGIS